MKGRGNYACRQKIYDAEKEPILDGLRRGRRLPDHRAMGEDHRVRRSRGNQDAAGIERRLGQDRCAPRALHRPEVPAVRPLLHHAHAPARRSKATSSSSTTTCFSPTSPSRRKMSPGILPEYHAVVFDEAHEIEDVAGQYFGVSVSNYRFQELRRDIARISRQKQFRLAGTRPHHRTDGANWPSISSACSETRRAGRGSTAARRS